VFCTFKDQFLIKGLKFGQYFIHSRPTLYEVQKIHGHTQIKTTQRYAHLSQDTLIDAANVVPSFMAPLKLIIPSLTKLTAPMSNALAQIGT
jgi:hypothetical protein